ncbi:InlB B-repeat-containing protein [Anaerorhabdus sp.]|uniref:InlB B-repeat-containing protein n=1 Tax=Anaerorhabdus sp. TaxID=1872524 RepID=UPI003A8BAB9F
MKELKEMSKIAKILLCGMVVLSMLIPNVFAESTVESSTVSNWTVKYEASQGGRVEGTVEERVENQKNPQASIIATAQEGYAFSHWIENEGNSYSNNEEIRVKIISKDITFTALFKKNVESEDIEKIEESNASGPDSLLMNKQLDTLTLSNPRLKVETTGDLKVASNSEKGYIASIRAESTNSADGVNQVWIGYRFTLPVPDGIPNTWLKFTDVSYSWLKDLETGTSTAKPRYDSVTRNWILEGKFYYDQAQGLGSSAVQEYGRSISISTSWMNEGQKKIAHIVLERKELGRSSFLLYVQMKKIFLFVNKS